MMKTSVVVSLLALLCCCLPASYAGVAKSKGACPYIISVQTGTRPYAGTDAAVSVTFQGTDGANQLHIDNLESWAHDNADPFEKGDLDFFHGNATCVAMDKVCRMTLVSSGTGPNPGWDLEYVRLQVPGNGAGRFFNVHQWLALDEPPYQLYVDKNLCAGAGTGAAIM